LTERALPHKIKSKKKKNLVKVKLKMFSNFCAGLKTQILDHANEIQLSPINF
jgi:hypothetical protein